jgi:hypothetical protein
MRMKRIIGYVLLGLGVVGFFAGNITASEREVLKKTYTTAGEHRESLTVSAGHAYEARIWVIDEETGIQQWAEAQATLRLADAQGEVFFERGVTAHRSSSEKTGGVSRAQNGASHRWTAKDNDPVTVTVTMDTGDNVELVVFKDLSQSQSLLPGLSILLGIVGVVLILRARAGQGNVGE